MYLGVLLHSEDPQHLPAVKRFCAPIKSIETRKPGNGASIEPKVFFMFAQQDCFEEHRTLGLAAFAERFASASLA